MADEVHDAQSAVATPGAPALPDNAGERLEAIAVRLENLATRLEG